MSRRRRGGSPLRAALLSAVALLFAIALVFKLPTPVGRTLLLLLAAWGIAALLTLVAFLITSIDDLGDMAWAALLGSAPAMWIVPAVMLLGFFDAVAEWSALALIALAACLLASQRAPRQLAAEHATHSPAHSLFQPPTLRPGLLLPATLGALLFQAGLACAYTQYRRTAAVSLALAAIVWTRSWVTRVAVREPDRPRSVRSSLGEVAFAILLTLAASTATFNLPDPANAAALHDQQRAATSLAAPPLEPGGRERHAVVAKAVPGVILRPKIKPRREWLRLLPSTPGAPLVLADPLSFPFTGEYHLFRSSSGHVPDDAPVEDGTPLDALFITTNGGSMETQAYQPLAPPVDFARCGQVQITLRSGEAFPLGATLQLFTTAGLEDLGTQVFGLERGAEETLPYFVPSAPLRPPVRAIRLIFRHDPTSESRNTKVAIVRFNLVPRAY